MTTIMEKIDQWPRTRGKDPIFKTSEDAIFYGALISNHQELIDKLWEFRALAYKQIELEKQRKAPSMQRIMDLAVKGQFFREAYEEAERIRTYK